MTDERSFQAFLAVRRYKAADREARHRIAADTAFFGEPIELYLVDRRLLLDVFVSAYSDDLAEYA